MSHDDDDYTPARSIPGFPGIDFQDDGNGDDLVVCESHGLPECKQEPCGELRWPTDNDVMCIYLLDAPIRFYPSVDSDGNKVMHSAHVLVQAYIRNQGWSIGPSDTTGFRGVLFEPGVTIAKWKNLTDAERAQCPAVVVGRGAYGDRLLGLNTQR